ncbi:MAG TPA: hypothetical protein VIL63_10370 [Terriglobales bacterium]
MGYSGDVCFPLNSDQTADVRDRQLRAKSDMREILELCSNAASMRRLHQLDTIPEGIIGVHPVKTFKRLISDDPVSSAPQVLHQAGEITNNECWVSFPSRREFSFHAKMYLQVSALEPAPPSRGEMRGLGHLGNAEHTLIKSSGFVLAASGHSKLHMF